MKKKKKKKIYPRNEPKQQKQEKITEVQRGKFKKEKIKSPEFYCCFEFISGMQEICVWTLIAHEVVFFIDKVYQILLTESTGQHGGKSSNEIEKNKVRRKNHYSQANMY